MITGDSSFIKQLNRGLILEKIVEHNGISRANLSKETGLNKATISVQVADLLDDGLLVEEQQEHTNLGRRPIILKLNHHAGFALGVDLDGNQIIFTLSNLLGSPVETVKLSIETNDYDVVLQILQEQIQLFIDRYKNQANGIIGVTIAIHGTVANDEEIYFIPKLQWRNKNLKTDLEQSIAVPIFIENNANLTALAESVYSHHNSANLLSITLHTGIGLGAIMNGQLVKGSSGYAGEVGHMIIVPDGKKCSCGNKGCFEQYASETNFLKSIGISENIDLAELYKDEQIKKAVDAFIQYISIGINNLTNLYNPETIVLNSALLTSFPQSVSMIEEQLSSTISHYGDLCISTLGPNAGVMGACVLAIKNFLGIEKLRLELCEDIQN